MGLPVCYAASLLQTLGVRNADVRQPIPARSITQLAPLPFRDVPTILWRDARQRPFRDCKNNGQPCDLLIWINRRGADALGDASDRLTLQEHEQ
jgi:hypothetical protein